MGDDTRATNTVHKMFRDMMIYSSSLVLITMLRYPECRWTPEVESTRRREIIASAIAHPLTALSSCQIFECREYNSVCFDTVRNPFIQQQ